METPESYPTPEELLDPSNKVVQKELPPIDDESENSSKEPAEEPQDNPEINE